MDLRLSLLELAAQHRSSNEAADRLNDVAGIDVEPQELQRSVAFGMAILAAALGGMGIIFWIAANWESLSRTGRFALLQALIVTKCTGAVFRPAARPARGDVTGRCVPHSARLAAHPAWRGRLRTGRAGGRTKLEQAHLAGHVLPCLVQKALAFRPVMDRTDCEAIQVRRDNVLFAAIGANVFLSSVSNFL